MYRERRRGGARMSRPNSLTSPVASVLRQVRVQALAGVPDHELLGRFAAERDEAAFAALVRRYGELVRTVCRRLLWDSHECEDVFQGTFLALAERAGDLAGRSGEYPSVGPWLVRVVNNMARQARAR